MGGVDEADRGALRAFIARGETRLSTMQRTAGVFVGGAGILALLPSFFKDAVVADLRGLLFSHPVMAIDRLLAIAVSATVLLPLVALFFLFKDLVIFYFTGHQFTAPDDTSSHDGGRFVPRFALSGLMVPRDDVSEESSMEITVDRARQVGLLVPETKDAQEKLWHLKNSVRRESTRFPDKPAEEADRRSELANFMLELTAARSRTLSQEAAKMELSLARHHFILRRLVLRYFKALLLFVLTTITSLATTLWLDPAAHGFSTVAYLPVVYAIWAIAASLLVRAPVHWIYTYSADANTKRHEFTVDQQIASFESFALLFLTPLVAILSVFAAMFAKVPAGGMDKQVLLLITASALVGVAVNGGFLIRGRRLQARSIGTS